MLLSKSTKSIKKSYNRAGNIPRLRLTTKSPACRLKPKAGFKRILKEESLTLRKPLIVRLSCTLEGMNPSCVIKVCDALNTKISFVDKLGARPFKPCLLLSLQHEPSSDHTDLQRLIKPLF